MLEFRDVAFCFHHRTQPVFSQVSFSLAAGSMMALLGGQSSGTSTVCRLAAGLLSDHGQLTGVVERQEQAAMLGDDPEAQLTGMATRVVDEVQLPGRLSGLDPDQIASHAAAALQQLGIGELAPRDVAQISGGQRQLTALAGLLALQKPLLILDQPQLSLDHQAQQRLLTALQAHCASGGAVLVAGHQRDLLTEACDQQIVLGDASNIWAASAQDIPSQDHESKPPDNTLNHTPLHRLSSKTPRSAAEDVPLEPPAVTPIPTPALTVESLNVRRAGRQVLQQLDLQLRATTVTSILGANGAGKSTVLAACAGLLEREHQAEVSGWILGPENQELTTMPLHRRSQYLAWVGQDPGAQLSASSVRAELEQAVPPHKAYRDVDKVLEQIGLSNESQTHPYDLPVSFRQDLVIGTALRLGPAVLLLDEPTLGRDVAGMRRLQQIITTFTLSGGTVLLTTHESHWATAISDQVYLVENGKLTAP